MEQETLSNIIDNIRYDITPFWAKRFDFTKIQKDDIDLKKWHVPCHMIKSENYDPPFSQEFDFPKWCDINALDAFEKMFDKKRYQIDKKWNQLTEDLYACHFDVIFGGITICFYWEQF